MNNNDTILTITWKVEDLQHALEQNGIEPSKDNIDKLLGQRNRLVRSLEERSIEEGWNVINSTISNIFVR